tara:strand:- start:1588 stop:1905 length:318 start_codon:yes stop_codon:yes gene_type:complete
MRKGIIYKIIDNSNNNCYYGATIQQLHVRKAGHKRDFKRYMKGGYKDKKQGQYTYSAIDIFKNNNYSYEIVEEIETDRDKKELLERELYYIRNFPCVNKLGKSTI